MDSSLKIFADELIAVQQIKNDGGAGNASGTDLKWSVEQGGGVLNPPWNPAGAGGFCIAGASQGGDSFRPKRLPDSPVNTLHLPASASDGKKSITVRF